MQKRVISLDFDGTIFNKAYIENHDVIEANKRFLNRLKRKNKKFETVTVFVGSNRQSYEHDSHNSNKNKTESAFTAITTIATYVKANLDKFLLADLESDSTPGTCFDAAINSVGDEPYEDHHRWMFDQEKLSMLYAQMHKSASEDESETIFDFYDDRGLVNGEAIDILAALRDYFTKYPMMIPHNTTLRLHHYNGGEVTTVASIKGTGDIDYDYYNTLHRMEKIALKHERGIPEKHFTRYITPENIKFIDKKDEKKSHRFGVMHRLFHTALRNKQKESNAAKHATLKNRIAVT